MSRPVVIALAVLAVALGATTAVLYQKYRTTSANYASLQYDEAATRNRYGAAINEIAAIQDSLNAIVFGEDAASLTPTQLQAEQKLTETEGDKALARIAVMKAGIERTKEKIQELDTRLKQNGIKISGLQKMVANLRKTVQTKEALVADLTTQVEQLETRVTGLQAEVQQGEETIRTQAVAIDETRRELGTVYYKIGTKQDLTSSGLVVAKGGLLGIGKTLEPSGHVKDDLFTAIDTDVQQVIRIPATRAEVLSAQPVSSYELTPVGDQLELHITDPEAFRAVKHLLIMTT
jgi:predicted RNase H-like nuclease (RuvC/YqgF family)